MTFLTSQKLYNLNWLVFILVYFAGLRLDQWPLIFILPLLGQLLYLIVNREHELLFSVFTKKVFVSLLAITMFLYLVLIPIRYFFLGYNIWDIGSFSTSIVNLIKGNGFYNSVMNGPQLADHFCPNLILLAPLYLLENTFVWLSLAKYILFFSCLFPLNKIIHFYKLHDPVRYLILLFWIFNPYTNSFFQSEVQPSSMSPFFILFGFYYWLTGKRFLASIFFFFLLGFKEHMGLVLVSLGAFVFLIQKEKILGIVICTIGVISGILIVYWATPFFSGVPNMHFGELDPTKDLFKKAEYLFYLQASVLFVGLWDVRTLLFILPSMAISFLSGKSGTYSLGFHNHDITMSLLFISLIFVISESKELIQKLELAKWQLYAVAISFVFMISISVGSVSRQFLLLHFDRNKHVTALKRLESFIGDKSKIYAQCNTGVYLSQCFGIQALSDTSFINKNEKQFVVLAPDTENWPFDSDQYAQLINRLEMDNMYSKVDGFAPLLVFEKKNGQYFKSRF